MNNYHKSLEKIIQELQKSQQVPRLLLHSCCAPCSSYVLEYLSQFFAVTVFYYNPNIYPDREYEKRVQEQKTFIEKFPAKHQIDFIEGQFDSSLFYESIKGYEGCKEGAERCCICYHLRLEETAKLADRKGFDYFCTTLSVSPLKNAAKINEIGNALAKIYEVVWLPSDFKKKEGYKRSIELSREYGLYRQNYCGCIFSQNSGEKTLPIY